MNPDLPAEVIAIILSKLDDVSALFNCRLVSRTWNTQCLSLLRRSKFQKTIGPSDIRKAIQFGNHKGQLILPFRLDQNLIMASEANKKFEQQCVAEFHTMGRHLARLMEICGTDCIREYRLDYDSCGAKGLVAFNKFLGLISQHLEKFILSFSPSEDMSCVETVQILRGAPVLLPKLKELSCSHARDKEDDEDEVEHEDIESVLIENSHNLQGLRLELGTNGAYNFCPKQVPAAFRTLKALDTGNLRYPVQFLEKCRASRLEPILETFVFNTLFLVENEDVRALEGTLELFSKTLRSIQVTLGPIYDNNNTTVALPLKFPACLPQLEHLSLKLGAMHYPSFVDPQQFNFRQGTFPVLNCVEIPFGCMLLTPPPKPHSAKHRFTTSTSTTFPTVKSLTFRLVYYTFGEDWHLAGTGNKSITWAGYDGCRGVCRPRCEHELEITPKAYVELVAQIFPSVTSLIVAYDETPYCEPAVRRVIKTVLESESVLAVEELEVRGLLGHRYLRDVLEGTGFVNKLTDLKKIRFNNPRSWTRDIFADLLFSTLLAKHFPELEEIEISPGLVGRSEAERMEKLQLAFTKYPAWNIKLV